MQNLSEPVRDLLAAILEALDIPHPATTGDIEAHDRILNDRAMHAAIALRNILGDGPSLGIEWTARYLRERLAEHPTDSYRHWGAPAGSSGPRPSCGKCSTPFDPADTRFDGRARHKDTPWCRRCVDNCGDGGAEHVCVICDPKRYGGETR